MPLDLKQNFNLKHMKIKNIQSGLCLSILFASIVCLSLASCQKDFLDKKPDKSLLVPTTLADFQALLDNTAIMNASPSLNLIAGDEFYTTGDALDALGTPYEENTYLWVKDNPYAGNDILDWDQPYKQVFYANVILDGIGKVPQEPANQLQWNQIKGSALFFRAFAFYNVAQEFAKPYIKSSAAADMGIPLRLTSEVNSKSTRASVEATYDQVISDLTTALPLLSQTAAIKSRPSQLAVEALLSRIYLSMGDYGNSKKWADTYLAVNNKLTDYNLLTATNFNPFPQAVPNGNDEVVFYEALIPLNFDYSTELIDSTLYQSFQINDTRRALLFSANGDGTFNFVGDYSGLAYFHFSGLATDEVYLNRAECFVRMNNLVSAQKDLNLLLANRYQTGNYTAINSTNADEILGVILQERKRELTARGLRWSDLRRLNQDSRYAVTLKRLINGQTYTLPPNDSRYVFPIPDNEISSSGIQQNPR
jgi:hypothetical protein